MKASLFRHSSRLMCKDSKVPHSTMVGMLTSARFPGGWLVFFFFRSFRGCEGIVIEGPNDKGRWEVQVPLGASLGGVFFWFTWCCWCL